MIFIYPDQALIIGSRMLLGHNFRSLVEVVLWLANAQVVLSEEVI